jgi:hypothetical protein
LPSPRGIIGRKNLNQITVGKNADSYASSTLYRKNGSTAAVVESISPAPSGVTVGGSYSPLIVAKCCNSVSVSRRFFRDNAADRHSSMDAQGTHEW